MSVRFSTVQRIQNAIRSYEMDSEENFISTFKPNIDDVKDLLESHKQLLLRLNESISEMVVHSKIELGSTHSKVMIDTLRDANKLVEP